ncbi:MAG: hypothetical protein M3Q39_06325 [Actinomycetota bacterium]|nr:hypothetical protein [Actinomycetota bacterium]
MSRRSELHPVIVEMRAEGLTWREIAARLGISKSLTQDYGSDATGAKALARKLKGSCRDCGTPIRSDTRPRPERCPGCWNAHRTEASKVRIVEAMRAWAERFGDPPTATDWNRGPSQRPLNRASAMRKDETEDEEWPSATSVVRVFGSWNAGISAAGFEPVGRGQHRNPWGLAA